MIRRNIFSRRGVVLVSTLTILTFFAGKFTGENEVTRNYIYRAGNHLKNVVKTLVTPTRIPITPAQRRSQQLKKHCNVFNPSSIPETFYKTKLNYINGSAVCYVHGMHDLVSKSVITSGSWESGHLSQMEQKFNSDPSLGLIDVGCNIGVYTLVAAMRQRKVVSVDINIENVKRVRKSVIDNKLSDRVTIVHNGISDRYEKFAVKTPTNTNIGDSFMVAPNANTSRIVSSILMDDLLEVIDFNRAMMKIDIQGHEFEGFHHADKLFTEIDIPLVLMEWVLIGPHKNQAIPRFIINFFRRFKYTPYGSIVSNTPLNWTTFQTWPYDIVWKKG